MALFWLPRAHPLVRRALERAAGRPPERDLLDLPGELEVLVGDAAGRVVLELHREPAPGHRQIGVVVRGLGQVADRVHQHERGGPAVGLEYPADPPVLVVPAGQRLQPLGDLRLVVGLLFRGRHRALLQVLILRYITTPPLTMIIWPVTNSDSSEARKRAAATRSSGVPQRPSGVRASTALRQRSSACSPNPVSMKPGARMFTRIRGATCRASDLLKLMMPPFAAAYRTGFSPAMPRPT